MNELLRGLGAAYNQEQILMLTDSAGVFTPYFLDNFSKTV
jgi:hypothetical protein